MRGRCNSRPVHAPHPSSPPAGVHVPTPTHSRLQCGGRTDEDGHIMCQDERADWTEQMLLEGKFWFIL